MSGKGRKPRTVTAKLLTDWLNKNQSGQKRLQAQLDKLKKREPVLRKKIAEKKRKEAEAAKKAKTNKSQNGKAKTKAKAKSKAKAKA